MTKGSTGFHCVKLSSFDSLIACQTIVVCPKQPYQTRWGSSQVKSWQQCVQSGQNSCYIRTLLQEALKLIEHVSDLHVPDYGTSGLTSTDAPPHPDGVATTEQVGGTGFQHLNPGVQTAFFAPSLTSSEASDTPKREKVGFGISLIHRSRLGRFQDSNPPDRQAYQTTAVQADQEHMCDFCWNST